MLTRSLVVRATIACACLIFASCESGHQPEKSEKARKVVLPAGETHEGWYFAAGDQVYIQGTVNGDLYAGAGIVEINGTVNGDVIAAGGDVLVGGTVSDDVRVAGGTIRIDGKVGKNVTAAGGTVRLGRTAEVNGSLLGAGGAVLISGSVGHDARIGAGDIDVAGSIGGTLDAASEEITVIKGATIGRDLNVWAESKDKIEIAEGSVKGAVNIHLEEEKVGAKMLGHSLTWFWWKFFWVGSLLITLLALTFLVPRYLQILADAILHQPGLSALWGAVGVIAVPLVTLLLCITLIGIPIGMLVLALFLWLLYVSQLSLGVVVGHAFFKAGQKSGWALFGWLALGVILVQAFTVIPYLGFLINLAGVIFGLGAMLIMTRNAVRRKPS